MNRDNTINYRPQQWKGNVFTPVCHSFGSRGGVHPSLPGQTPPEMATAADGTHPTGMHSCFNNMFVI